MTNASVTNVKNKIGLINRIRICWVLPEALGKAYGALTPQHQLLGHQDQSVRHSAFLSSDLPAAG